MKRTVGLWTGITAVVLMIFTAPLNGLYFLCVLAAAWGFYVWATAPDPTDPDPHVSAGPDDVYDYEKHH